MLGSPGRTWAPPPEPKPIEPVGLDADLTLEADVVVIGSGAGGAVIAAELAQRGASVVVVEAGGYFNEADFNQYELWAWQNLYWRGRPTPARGSHPNTHTRFARRGGGVTQPHHS